MKTLIETPPRTIMEVYKSLPEGTLAELIDKTIYMSPAPINNHQVILNEINFQLMLHFKGKKTGMVYVSPHDVYLDEESNAVQPDLIVILNENSEIVDPKGYIHGAPDLLIEVLSEGNRDHDMIRKKDLYERFGVKEYWMVDPETKLVIGYTFSKGHFNKLSESIGEFFSPLLNLTVKF